MCLCAGRIECRGEVVIRNEVREYIHHVTNTTSWQSVQASTDTLDGDDVEVPCAGVVCAVHDGTAVDPCQLPILASNPRWILVVDLRTIGKDIHGKTEGHLELATGGTTAVHRVLSAMPFFSFKPVFSAFRLIHLFRSLKSEALRGLKRRRNRGRSQSFVCSFFVAVFACSSNLCLLSCAVRCPPRKAPNWRFHCVQSRRNSRIALTRSWPF